MCTLPLRAVQTRNTRSVLLHHVATWLMDSESRQQLWCEISSLFLRLPPERLPTSLTLRRLQHPRKQRPAELSISPYSERSSLSIINMHMWMCLNTFIHLHKSTQDTQLPNVFTYNEHLPGYTAGLKQDQAGDYVEQ